MRLDAGGGGAGEDKARGRGRSRSGIRERKQEWRAKSDAFLQKLNIMSVPQDPRLAAGQNYPRQQGHPTQFPAQQRESGDT